jgi:hypothetical protein
MRDSVIVPALSNAQEVRMSKRLLLVAACAAILVSGVAQRSSPLAAQDPPAQQSQRMQDMMKMHEQMMADMKAADAKLDALVKEMNAASGNARVDAMAAVVAELVRQNRSMHEHMVQMHQQMMGGRGMMNK